MLRRLILACRFALVLAPLTLACQSSVLIDARDHRGAPGIGSPVTVATGLPVALACLAEGAACDHGDACCGGLFCADTGYGYGYGNGTCSALLPSGGYCTEGAQCQSGLCSGYLCVDHLPACVVPGAYCGDGAPCCAGNYCLPQSYAPTSTTCAPLEPAGSYCAEGVQCESGVCALGTCRAADCKATGADCFSEASCCDGFCTAGPSSNAPGACTIPQPAGAHCETSMWCASMSCVASVCAP